MKKWLSFNFSFFIMTIAIFSFAYSVYRADVNQRNNICREAGFQILKELNQLQIVIDKERYGSVDEDRFINGWANVMMIEDLSIYFPTSIKEETVALKLLWSKSFENLKDEQVNKSLFLQIKTLRDSVKYSILHL